MTALAECLHRLDPQLYIRQFQGLTWFLDWMKEARSGPAQLHRAGYGYEKNQSLHQTPEDSNLALVIVSESLLGARKKELLEKFSDWFSKKQLFKFGSQVPIMVTSYQHQLDVLKTFQLRPIQQILFKPFDEIQLENNLRISLAQSLKIKTPDVYPIQNTSRCEVLQPTDALWMNEFGLFARTTQPIPTGKTRKYYCTLFDSKPNHSLIGVCTESWREKPDENIWVNFIKFIGLDQIQIRQLKQHASVGKMPSDNKYMQAMNEHLKDPSQFRLVNVLLICKNKDIRAHLKKILSESFANTNVTFLEKLSDFSHFLEHKGTMLAGQRAPEYLDLVIVDQEFANTHPEAQKTIVAQTRERFQLQNEMSIPFLLTSETHLEKSKEFQLAHVIQDILYTPLDTSFVKRKFKLNLPQFILSEDAAFDFAPTTFPVQAADPITAHSLSEFSFVFDSNRQIDLDEFRSITLWETNEIEMPVLDGKCIAKSPVPNAPTYFRYQFSFFGLTHKELQKIRYWTSQNLIRKT